MTIKGYWTCQRVECGHRCKTVNPNRKQVCVQCGKRRAPRKRPAHMSALEQDYAAYVALNGGEHCGICGATPKPGGRRLHRDHDHRSSNPRGLLCFRCNAALRPYMTREWLIGAVHYLDAAAERTS